MIQRVIHIKPFGPFGPFGPGPVRGRSFFLGGPNWGFGISRLIIMILFLLFFGAIAYFVIRHFDHAQSHHHSHVINASSAVSADSAAADTLKMRFAKGEIDEDEFTRRMSLLKDHQSVT
ncbi:MAG: SHOCT domain-containing protein [Acidimicrobiales bacterium]